MTGNSEGKAMGYQIVTDTAGNLPKRIADGHGIIVLPLTYRFMGQELTCTDVEAFDGADFYGKMRSGEAVVTSQIVPQTYLEVFEPILKQGDDIICVCMASGISGTYGSASVAGRMLQEDYPERRVEVIDAMGAALGEGFVAVRSAELRSRGVSFEDNVEQLRRLSVRMCNVFTVDDLMYLRRGGRLSNMAAIVGTVLGIKPLLKGSEEAKIVAFSKVRGRKKSIEALAECYTALVEAPEEQTVGIVEADCREDARRLEAMIQKSGKEPKEILTVGYEPVTGSHVGPGALALFFEGREDVRTALDSYPHLR
ncbi:MAG: DegV family protein [Lachnospiraceae bacterium]|nr:DegV family protein [Lachnospiraceae bacterium]